MTDYPNFYPPYPIEHMIEQLRDFSAVIPTQWDGRRCITTMKNEGGKNWRQMEWGGFYAEHIFDTLGAQYGFCPGTQLHKNTRFDYVFDTIPVDVKVHSVLDKYGNASTVSILNDKTAIDQAIAQHGVLPFIIFSVIPTYDHDESFKRWHDSFKGKPSAYVQMGNATGRCSRKRKSALEVQDISIYALTESNRHLLHVVAQGRNSNGKPRPPKYSLDSSLCAPDAVIDFSVLSDNHTLAYC